jgi:hypothetical protein
VQVQVLSPAITYDERSAAQHGFWQQIGNTIGVALE